MKGQDIVILLKLVCLEHEEQQRLQHPKKDARHEDSFSVRGLEFSLGISKTEINAAIKRSISSGRSKTELLAAQGPIAAKKKLVSASQ